MAVLPFTPSQSGYSVQEPGAFGYAPLDGGLARTRADHTRVNALVQVRWQLTSAQYATLYAFYEQDTSYGAEAFQVQLILDDAALTEHDAHFVPGTLSLDAVEGDRYSVSASLEVQPLPVDDDFNNSVMDLFESYPDSEDVGGDAAAIFLALEQLVNVHLPPIS